MDFSSLYEKGWLLVEGISSAFDLLELSREVGNPVLGPTGELIKEIRRKPIETALPESQSAIYGLGRFPLHTDTVFWASPAKFVLFRAYGDIRRLPR